jgi:hypothetical protein
MENINFINKLPYNIILRIIPYTYNVQKKDLLQDIINYTKMKTQIINLYFHLWIIQRQEPEPEDKNWLINDIFSYANDDNPTMLGYVDKFYNIFKRMIQIQTNKDVEKYVLLLEKKNVSTQINILLGLLRPNERSCIYCEYR